MKISHIFDFDPPAKDSMGAQRLVEFLVDGERFLGEKVELYRTIDSLDVDDWDVFHFHTPPDMFEFDERFPNLKHKALCTMHGWSFWDREPEMYNKIHEDKRIVYLSTPHRNYHDRTRTAHIVTNFIDCDSYKYNLETKEDYYLMMCGIDWWDQKSIPLVLDIAKTLKVNVLIAGGGKNQELLDTLKRCSKQYQNIEYAGSVNGEVKNEILRNARATLILPKFDACSVLIAESLACGTPIICWGRRIYPDTPFEEVLDTSVALFCDDVAELKRNMVSGRISSLSRKRCREYAEKFMSHIDGAKEYIQIYRKMILNEEAR